MSTPDSTLEDRLQKLEMERDSLGLQVSVLTDQVEAQTDKIHDLESVLNKRDSSLHKVSCIHFNVKALTEVESWCCKLSST